jgi:hypothetical protein
MAGVPAERDAMARLIIRGWRESLERGNIRDFAWNSMVNCESHSPAVCRLSSLSLRVAKRQTSHAM